MLAIALVNIFLFAIGIAVAAGLVSTSRLSGSLDWLHGIIGITPPAAEKARLFSLVWIASMIVIVDGILFMLVFLTMRLIHV